MPFPKPPPPYFQPFRKDLPVTSYTRSLPHWRQAGATYFVTCHLNDALPAAAIRALTAQRHLFDQQHPPPHTDTQLRARAHLLAQQEERWLDAGHGNCPFQLSEHQTLAHETLLHFDVSHGAPGVAPRYHLDAFTVMPNHLHLLVRPIDGANHPLEKILQSWKRHLSRQLNRAEDRQGPRWFEESYDRIVRDSEHAWRCLQYIGANGAKAGLREHEYTRWVCLEWIEAGWSFMSKAERCGIETTT